MYDIQIIQVLTEIEADSIGRSMRRITEVIKTELAPKKTPWTIDTLVAQDLVHDRTVVTP